jgi:hypothetical protein
MALLLAASATGSSHAQAAAAQPAACPPPPSLVSVPASSGVGAPGVAQASGPYQPSPEEIVACVGTREISGAAFATWAAIADKAGEPAPSQPAAGPDREEMTEVMGFLISSYWLIGEASDLHIHVSAAAVRRRFDRLREKQFRRRGEFGKFLERTGETVADLLFRVRLSMLEADLRQRVAGHGSVRDRQRALEHFGAKLLSKWRAQTYCESRYATRDCGRTASTL